MPNSRLTLLAKLPVKNSSTHIAAAAMPIHFILMGRIKNSSTCCSGHIHA